MSEAVDGEADDSDEPGKSVNDAIGGITDGLENETDGRGRPVKGHFVNPDGSAEGALDSLPVTIGENGEKTLSDGSVAGIHISSTTGHKTLHINRPPGYQDVKIRFPGGE